MSIENYQKLEAYFKEIRHIENANSILFWDEETVMPEGAFESRNYTLASLSRLIHQKVASNELKSLIDSIDQKKLDSPWQKANYHWIKKRNLKATIIPDHLIETLTLNSKESEQAWRKLRSQNDWQSFLPYFKKTLETVKQIANIKSDYFGISPYDALLDDFAPGISSNNIDGIFNQLKQFLPDVIKQIVSEQKNQKLIPFDCKFPLDKQAQLAKELMTIIGFDFNRGRLDTAVHPFCGGIKNDVRITTRYREDEFISSVMAVCHETGHAMYELQSPQKWQYQPVGDALGMTVHESQSLLVEMHACRSNEFMMVLSDLLIRYFGPCDAFSSDNLYRYYTKVTPSLIRVDADEVTYPLHVILRYELEKALIHDEISPDDLPSLWDEKMKLYLELDTKGDYKNGVMQDVHWPSGLFGYFPSYALGSMLASSFYQAALKEDAHIPSAIRIGDFKPLMNWLKINVHQKASLLPFNELVIAATNKPFSAEDYINHIKARYLAKSDVKA